MSMTVPGGIEGILWLSLAVFKYVLYRVDFTYARKQAKHTKHEHIMREMGHIHT